MVSCVWQSSNSLEPISVISKHLNAVRGARELARRTRAAFARGQERTALKRLASEPVHLNTQFATLTSTALLEHFRNRRPRFFLGFESLSTGSLQPTLFPEQTSQLLEAAAILCSSETVEWLKDPVSEKIWPLDYHSDISFQTHDGSDIRSLWEINRLNHFITLGRAFAVTRDEAYAVKLFSDFDSWLEQNPLGRGPNWNCAMEVALRAVNLLAAFTLCRQAQCFTEERLLKWLQSLEQHGGHIERNLEFSYLGTTNHYLTDIVGLLWIGLVLPELNSADKWRNWAFQQLLNEMDKQVLPDGADYECATGYHRYALELFLYSFILCRQHQIEIEMKYWQKLRAMLHFVKSYLRPDGSAPLIGDSDGSQLLPIAPRQSDQHSYVLGVGALATADDRFAIGPITEEILWLFGESGVSDFKALCLSDSQIESQQFPAAGICVLRQDDLYLLFNAARHLRAGRSSHRHNDALSIEVYACGRAFIVDPGTYVYGANLAARHAFRSTAYHSTIQVDDSEQSTIHLLRPFHFGNEAKPAITHWESTIDIDRVSGMHVGYERLTGKVRHERRIDFYKRERWWLIEDRITGRGAHKITTRFHFADGLEILESKGSVSAVDETLGVKLLIIALDGDHEPELEPQFVSRQYGSRFPSLTGTWKNKLNLPGTLRWALVPIWGDEDEQTRRLAVARDLAKIVI